MTHASRKTNDIDRDQYFTPPWPVRLLLDQWDGIRPEQTIAEPCCGRGDIAETMMGEGYNDIVCGDISPCVPREKRSLAHPPASMDARSLEAREHYVDLNKCEVVVTNPPYYADTGTAGGVMEAIVEWGRPTAALLSVSWVEACKDRQWAWLAEDWRRPCQVLVLPRVEYEYPGDEASPGAPGASMWVIWHPSHDGSRPTVEHFSKVDRDRYQGQTSLLGEVAE